MEKTNVMRLLDAAKIPYQPMIFNLLITLILTRLNVEKANEERRMNG